MCFNAPNFVLLSLLLMLSGLVSRAERVLYYDFEEGGGTVILNHGTSAKPGNFIGGNREGSWEMGQPGYGGAIELRGGDVRTSWSSSGCGEFGACSSLTGLPADVRFVDTELSLGQLNVNGGATFMAWLRWDGFLVEPGFGEVFAVSSRTGSGGPSRRGFPINGNAFRLMLWQWEELEDRVSFHGYNQPQSSTIEGNSSFASDPKENWTKEWIHVAYQFRDDEVQIFVNGDPIF